MASEPRAVKVVFLGDAGVGKSSIVLRFVNNHFDKFSESTIGAAFMSKDQVIDDQKIKWQIWDTAGQEKYKSLAPMYYRGAAAAIVVYDITRESSFDVLRMWVKELQQFGPDNIVIALAGNKCDLEDERKVTATAASAFASKIGAIHVETSAKNSRNVDGIFKEICRKLPSLHEEEEETTSSTRDPKTISLDSRRTGGGGGGGGGSENKKKKKGGCC